MNYVSTRGEAPALGFDDVLLTGLARDGGLYVPEAWPRLDTGEIAAMAGSPYQAIACSVMRPFIGGEVPDVELRAIVDAAYAGFSHRAVTPLVQIGPGDWILELFHGPTLSFKDLAMQVLGRLMDRSLKRRGTRATIVGATSGDTGSAAIEAFRGRDAIDVFILHPKGRTSEVQRKQMTTVAELNVHNIAIEGTFDDCQAIVKALFNDHALRDRLRLAGVNSINWARIMAQVVYYFVAAVALGAPARKVSFTVPTGNFGDVFAGSVARAMGLPIGRLVVATNQNDILDRTLRTGVYEPRAVVPTTSPSMDIQVSSNFERALYEAAGRRAERIRELMAGLAQGTPMRLSNSEMAALTAAFDSERVGEVEVADNIRATAEATGYVLDPHTAVGIAAAQRVASRATTGDPLVPMVTLATAHPAKFPDAVLAATGRRPDTPARLASQLGAEERFTVLANDARLVASFVSDRSRAGGARQ